MHARANGTLLAAYSSWSTEEATLRRSADDAASWTSIPVVNPPRAVFGFVDLGDRGVFTGGRANATLRSLDDGATWTAANAGLDTCNGFVAAMVATGAGSLLAATTNFTAPSSAQCLYVSSNGQAWTRTAQWNTRAEAPLALLPIAGGVRLILSSGGIYDVSSGQTTTAIGQPKLRIPGATNLTRFDYTADEAVVVDGYDPYRVLTSADGGETWAEVLAGVPTLRSIALMGKNELYFVSEGKVFHHAGTATDEEPHAFQKATAVWKGANGKLYAKDDAGVWVRR